MKATRRSCVLVADRARARLFMYRPPNRDEDAPATLIEAEDLVNPWRRRRDSEMFSDSRPGLRQAQRGGPRHGVNDRREGHREDDDRRFAVDVVERARELCDRMGRCPLVIVASPGTLGAIRAALSTAPAWLRDCVSAELDRDLTRMEAPRVHDWLAAMKVLPPRARLGLAR